MLSLSEQLSRSHAYSIHSVIPSNGSGNVFDENKYLEMTVEELMRQCEMDTYKASGLGGQHRNKREYAIRLKHVPTGIVAPLKIGRNTRIALLLCCACGLFWL